jgi:hypothetical protein
MPHSNLARGDGIEPEARQRRLGARPVVAMDPGPERQVLADAQRRLNSVQMTGIGDPLLEPLAVADQRDIAQPRIAAGHRNQPGKLAQQRRLADPVRPAQRRRLPRLDPEAEVVEHQPPGAAAGEIVEHQLHALSYRAVRPAQIAISGSFEKFVRCDTQDNCVAA